MKNFKSIISENRKKLNLTQRQLAEKINVSDKQISKWESVVSYPHINIINSLAIALEISVNELLESDELKSKNIDNSRDYNLLKEIKTSTIISLSAIIFNISLFIIANLVGYYYEIAGIIVLVASFVLLFLSITYLLITNINENNKISFKINNELYKKHYYYKNIAFILVITIPIVVILLNIKSWYLAIDALTFKSVAFNALLLILLVLLEIPGLLRKTLPINVRFKNIDKVLKYSILFVLLLLVLNTLLLNLFIKFDYELIYKYFYVLNIMLKIILSAHITSKIIFSFLID